MGCVGEGEDEKRDVGGNVHIVNAEVVSRGRLQNSQPRRKAKRHSLASTLSYCREVDSIERWGFDA